MLRSALFASVALGLLAGAGSATSEPASAPVLKAYPPDIAKRLRLFDNVMAQYGLNDVPRGAAASVKLWKSTRFNRNNPITVCFFHGAPALRALVRDAAMQWAGVKGVLLPLKFQQADCRGVASEHIRVAFCRTDSTAKHEPFCAGGENAGRWSLVGMQSADPQITSRRHPSMNLQDFDRDNFRPGQALGIALHEFGHAIGFEHEHQNPYEKCSSELNWIAIHKVYTRAPYYWDRQRIKYGFEDLFRQGVLAERIIAARDPDTVMSYELPAELFNNGKSSNCYRKARFRISSIDRNLLRRMYPANPKSQRRLNSENRRVTTAAITRKRGADALKSLPGQLQLYLAE